MCVCVCVCGVCVLLKVQGVSLQRICLKCPLKQLVHVKTYVFTKHCVYAGHTLYVVLSSNMCRFIHYVVLLRGGLVALEGLLCG